MTDLISRRDLLKTGGAGLAALSAGGLLGSPAWARPWRAPSNPFVFGVASGEPAADGVVLWTRLALDALGQTPMPSRRVPVRWEIADDEGMRRVRDRGVAFADPGDGHSVHVAVRGLRPGREYWYRFIAAGEESVTGRTLTAPAFGASPAQLRFCFVSCSQFEHGYFTAYKRIIEDDPAFVVHVGDYIYEYGTDVYVAPGGNVRHHVGGEINTLADYRQRYGQYHTDPDLLEARRLLPFVTTPDDHEVENNYATLTSEIDTDADQDPAIFARRRSAAYQAYFEFMPMSPRAHPRDGGIQLFRELPQGDLCDLVVGDTRQFRTDQPCDDKGGSNCAAMDDPNATLPGLPQEQWLVQTMGASRSRWNVLAQQVMMAQRDTVAGTGVGYSTDAWDGYRGSRARVLGGFQNAKVRNPIVLTGDVHQHYAADLLADFKNPASPIIGSELVATSVSTGGDGNDTQRPQLFADNPWFKFNVNRRGYVRCTMTKDDLTADFRTLAYVKQPGAPASTRASFVVQDGKPGLQAA